jgi:hypothetical protein
MIASGRGNSNFSVLNLSGLTVTVGIEAEMFYNIILFNNAKVVSSVLYVESWVGNFPF